ncbi:MAG: HD domain-containing protein [Spirochaetes bacterium]|nr:HD domain-containing protein [Spirochaetota bacterium]
MAKNAQFNVNDRYVSPMQNMNLDIAIPENILPTILNIAGRFRDAGFQCYLIGGSVRDLILGNEIYDYDFATDARPEEITRLFRKTIPTGIKHGTVSVLADQWQFEITTYRSDGKYIDGRHPDSVSFSNDLRIDVDRRDFTINGLAFDPLTGELIDHVEGLRDLQSGIIRTIGDPIMRFTEDGLRPIRACRFASKLNFTIEEKTLRAITETLGVVKGVSHERIRDEFLKILESEKPSLGIEYLRTTGLLPLFLPELAECHDVSQNRYHIYDVYYHSVYSCDAAPREHPMIRLAALLHDVGKVPTRHPGEDGDFTFYNHEVVGAKMVKKIMKRLKFSNEQIETVNNLILNHMFHYTDEWTDGAVRRFIRKVGLENIEDLFALRMADRKGNGARKGLPAPINRLKQRIDHVIEQENAFSVRDLNINGTILMEEFGLEPGPIIGMILNQLLETVLDNPELNEREKLTALSREILDRHRPPE